MRQEFKIYISSLIWSEDKCVILVAARRDAIVKNRPRHVSLITYPKEQRKKPPKHNINLTNYFQLKLKGLARLFYSTGMLTFRRLLRRKLRMRWFFDMSKVKESSFFKSDLTDPFRFLMRIFWKLPIKPFQISFFSGFYIKIIF